MMLKGSLLLCVGSWLTLVDSGAQLVITANVDSFAEEAFLAWNDGQDMRSNMVSAFKHFVRSSGLTMELSVLEEMDYMKRFIGDCTERLEGLQVEDVNSVWTKALKEALDDEMPAVTDQSVENINSQGLGWKAKKHDDVAASRREFKKLLGLIVPKDIEPELGPVGEIRARSSVPASFDSRSQWPRCADVFVRHSNQGGCGSCWAFAGANSLEHRMCIATNGSTKVTLSRQFITTCAGQDLNYGCNGGWMKAVFEHFHEVGFPLQSCSPYLGTDKYGCPSQCQSGYPRSLQSDLYRDSSRERITELHMEKQSHEDYGLLEIYQNGPVSAAVPASPYGEWVSYSSGFFEGDCPITSVDHAVVVIGWTTQQGGLYYTLLNSWGRGWGEHGTMKLARCNVKYFVIPGPIDVPAQGWPPADPNAPVPTTRITTTTTPVPTTRTTTTTTWTRPTMSCPVGVTVCAIQDSEWHETIDRASGDWHLCAPTVAQTRGTCNTWCGERGYLCARAQDDAPHCTLNPDHTRQNVSQNGCNQSWYAQMCQCGSRLTAV